MPNRTPSRKESEREARQRFVLAAARRLFAEQGIENTSMEEIAAAAEYTRRTLYAYFKSRDEICLRVLVEDQTARWAMQREAVAAAGGGLAKLLAWAEALYAFSREHPHTLRLQLYWDWRGIERERVGQESFAVFEALNEELAAGLRSIFREGIDDGSLRGDLDADMCISQFLYSLRNVLNQALSPGYTFARFDADEYVRHFLELFSRGIRNPGASTP